MPKVMHRLGAYMGLHPVPGSDGSDHEACFCRKKFPGTGPLGGRTVDAGHKARLVSDLRAYRG